MIVIKICFVGLGSIAKRHINNLWEIYESVEETLSIDVFRSGRDKKVSEEMKDKINKVYYELIDVPNNYDAIFITNPTKHHFETLMEFHDKGENFFIEKPVFHDTDIDLSRITFREKSAYYVACPLRYTSVISYLKENIDISKVYSVRVISSSYLPDWRPTQDYRMTYSSNAALGGGVSIDLIHEWDYIQYLLGMPEKIYTFINKVSNLEIDSDDVAIYIGKYSDKTVELHLDYFGRSAIRKIEIFSENDTIVGDLIEGKVTYLKAKKEVILKENRDLYQIKELKYFLSLVKGSKNIMNDISMAYRVLKLAKGEI